MSNLLQVRVKKFHMASGWKWNVNEDCCGICRQAFEACCPDCKFPGDDCVPIWGECKHVFHLHCILKWVKNSEKCPYCRAEWKVAS